MNNKPTKTKKTKKEFFILFTVSILFIITFIMVSMGVTSALAILGYAMGLCLAIYAVFGLFILGAKKLDEYHNKNKEK
jgi:Mn2+/Fe2+ NRAMP family transporter